MGTPFDLRKIVVLGQASKMEKFCMKIISYPVFTHKEQMITNMKKQGNVDHQSKNIAGVPQTAFPKKHGLYTKSVNQLKVEKTWLLSIFSLFSEPFSAVTLNQLGI
jgi:hypothetical protein